jgi:hypothetical protein
MMKRLACLALPLILCACGATRIRPEVPDTGNWQNLRVKVQTGDAEQTKRLRDELKRTHLFGPFVEDGPADLVISAVDEHVVGRPTGGFCFDYALDFLTLGVIPEFCDQKYDVRIDASSPATGSAAQFSAELTQRRFVGWFGAITSLGSGWHFFFADELFGENVGNPTLARAALHDQKPQMDQLLKP